MAVDYSQIAHENELKYGTDIDNFGPKLLADRYSDPTHFVYELLQNAEDALSERLDLAGTTTPPRAAKFFLFKDRLEFRHFGIPFGRNHIRAICDIARSSKLKTPSAIGHFGIGFKSVYAFTRSPEVHSCGESFVIESLVRPAAVARKQTAEGETMIVLPFNHAENSSRTSSSESYGIIAERLRKLGLRTLLFLRRLDEVDWRIEGCGFGRYLRELKKEAEGIEHVTLVGEERGKATMKEHWLLFCRAVSGENAESGIVEIAYQLQQTKEKPRGQIRRTKDSPLCVYFATDLQTNLGFLVQGPFHLTQNRDNIRREDKWNKALAKEVGKLTADSLSKLKELGLLSISALNAMPLEREPFETETGTLFLPIYDAVLQALKKHPLIPSVDKRFVKGAAGVLVGGPGLTELFSRNQLQVLFGNDRERDWITPDITDEGSTQRLHDYLYRSDCVDAGKLEADDLPRLLDEAEGFLQKQDIKWFARFYRFLLKHESLWTEGGGLREQPIIRLADGSNVSPFGLDGAANAFLPTGSETGPKTIDPKLAKGDALTFLRKLRIRVRDAVAEVLEDILPQDYSGEAPTERKHEHNLRRIFQALGQESSDHAVLVKNLKETAFLHADNAKTGKRELKSPSDLLYFTSPRLSDYFKGQDDCWFLVEPSLSKNAKVWLVKLGVGELPALQSTEEVKARRLQEIALDEPGKRVQDFGDYDLHGLDRVLRWIRKHGKAQPKQAGRLSRVLWQILVSVADEEDGNFLKGFLKWKRPRCRLAEEESFDAYFVEELRKEAWLPDRKGIFRKPSEMQEQELPFGFERNQKLRVALDFQTPLSEKLKKVIPTKLIKVLELAQSDPRFADELCRAWKKRGAAASTAEPARTLSAAAAASKPQQEREEQERSTHSVRPKELEAVKGESATKPPATAINLDSDAQGSASSSQPTGQVTPRTDFLQTRIRVAPGDEPQSTAEAVEMAESRSRVDQAGIAQVKAHEEKAGRFVEELRHNHPGYDLKSKNESGEVLRYIEVKSTGSDWNGVLLSAIQFREAQRLGDHYWLYVVENAEGPNEKVYPIQNPAGLAEKFIFDSGWKQISRAAQRKSS